MNNHEENRIKEQQIFQKENDDDELLAVSGGCGGACYQGLIARYPIVGGCPSSAPYYVESCHSDVDNSTCWNNDQCVFSVYFYSGNELAKEFKRQTGIR